MLLNPRRKSKFTLPSLSCRSFRRRKWTCLTLILIFLVVYSKLVIRFSTYPIQLFVHILQEVEKPIEHKVEWVRKNREARRRQDKTILIWNYKEIFPYLSPFQPGSISFAECKDSNLCEIYHEMNLPVSDYDAIVISGEQDVRKLPKKRSSDQVYIFYSELPPTKINIHKIVRNEFFNWTMTYRRDSDIIIPAADFIESNSKWTPKKKSKGAPVVWFQMGKVDARFEKLFENLNLYIDIKVHRLTKGEESASAKDYDKFETKHKFVLFFQDSDCADYASRDIFETLTYELVPVVFGLTRSQNLFPDNAIIYGESFKDIKALGTFLKYLSSNETEYLKHLDWKHTLEVDFARSFTFCNLCRLLNSDLPNRSYNNLREWWQIKGNKEVCKIDNI